MKSVVIKSIDFADGKWVASLRFKGKLRIGLRLDSKIELFFLCLSLGTQCPFRVENMKVIFSSLDDASLLRLAYD